MSANESSAGMSGAQRLCSSPVNEGGPSCLPTQSVFLSSRCRSASLRAASSPGVSSRFRRKRSSNPFSMRQFYVDSLADRKRGRVDHSKNGAGPSNGSTGRERAAGQYFGLSWPGAGGGGWTKWSTAGILLRPGRVSGSLSSCRRRVSLRQRSRSAIYASVRRFTNAVQQQLAHPQRAGANPVFDPATS
jgi:hypothetical protein